MSQRSDVLQDFGVPPLSPWVKNVLIALFVLYVVELVLQNFMGLPLWATLTWQELGGGFRPWQLLTRYTVQGPNVGGTVFAFIALYFALPVVEQLLDRRQMIEAVVATVIGGSAMGLLLDAVGVVGGVGYGWSVFALSAFMLFGLARPTSEIRLFFVLPVKGIFFYWAALVFALLMVLGTRSIGAADEVGAWVGVTVWWNWFGPGSRRRKLIRDSKRIERELKRFQVLPGGRNDNDNGPYVN